MCTWLSWESVTAQNVPCRPDSRRHSGTEGTHLGRALLKAPRAAPLPTPGSPRGPPPAGLPGRTSPLLVGVGGFLLAVCATPGSPLGNHRENLLMTLSAMFLNPCLPGNPPQNPPRSLATQGHAACCPSRFQQGGGPTPPTPSRGHWVPHRTPVPRPLHPRSGLRDQPHGQGLGGRRPAPPAAPGFLLSPCPALPIQSRALGLPPEDDAPERGVRGTRGRVNVSCSLKMQPVTPSSSKSQRGHGNLNVQLSISSSYLLNQDWSPHTVTGESKLTDGRSRVPPTQLGSQGSGFPARRTRETRHPGKEEGARVSPPARQQPVPDDKNKDKIQGNPAVPGDWGRGAESKGLLASEKRAETWPRRPNKSKDIQPQ